ncbi:unnamed protein product [Phytophthora lilii]|uniref:Unnamed protein product n=1 Tax=Phytophthora lilii TaxID=2077276 RepID=A0A9W6TA21_9STRA|nr:unnamed protein product [Phytophthora lilii]
MEAAIASLESAKTGIRSDSLLKPSGGGDVDGRVLSLSDHKRIARLQAALTAVAKAYDAGAVVERAEAKDPNRNLICAVAGAAMMQATRDCTSSRTNCCIWAPQAEKLHVLLEWMMKREAKACDYVRQLLLQWIELSAEKQKQLAASLSLFELLQRRRRNLMNIIGEKGSLSMMADRVGAYMDALRAIVKRGITQVADSCRVKPSKLGLIALETLGMLCGDVASQYTTLDKPGKQTFISHGLACKMVESMHFFLVILRQWHMHSPRRQFLSYALEHLHAYVKACDNLFRIVDADGCRLGKDSDSNILEALDVLCWHWETTVPMVCTRSDVSSRIQKNQPGEVLVRVLRKWSVDVLNTKGKLGGRRVVLSPEVAYAQLRYVCILMDFAGGIKGCSKAFEGFSAVTKTYFVGFFIRVLSIARKNRDDIAVVTILKVLRAVLLHDDAFNLLSSRDEEQTFLSQLLRLHSNALPVYNNSERWASNQAELEFFISEFVIARELFITELVARIKDSSSQANQSTVEVMATWFIDVYQFGISQAHSKPMKSPSEMNKCIDQIRASAAENDALKEQQDKLVVLCFGPNGYVKGQFYEAVPTS